MQTSLTYRTNRDLFSNHYLSDHLRETEPWNEVDEEVVREAYTDIREIFEEKRDRVADYNESQLERNFIRPVFDRLGIPFEIEETVERNARRPDYGFFETEDAADAAFDRSNFYEEAIAVADAKRWGRKLDTRGEEKRDFENPSYQIHAYLQETPVRWAVLTNGQKWRIYYGPTSHRLDSFYEIDLPTLLQHVEGEGNLDDFKDFYLFFRRAAFVEDSSGDCFLDDVFDESKVFAEALGEDLQDNIYEAIRVLAEGFLETNDDLGEEDLELVHDSSLIYLYRLIFVLYAESEGRDLLPTENEIYSESYSLNELKRTVADNRDATQQHYQAWQTKLWDQLDELFVLIDQGSQGEDIPKEDLYIPAYNGGLFRTSPDSNDSEEAQFLATHEVSDSCIAEVIDLLTRREAEEGEGLVFVDYSSLDERHLGSIYEGLLEYKLDIADSPLALDDGEYEPTESNENAVVKEGDVYLRTDSGERKATGSYYTPEYVVEYIVEETLGPLIEDIRGDLVSSSADTTHEREGFAKDFANRVFELKILDPAMGSGHFLVNAVDYLAREIIDAQELQDKQAMQKGDEEAISEPRTKEGELRDVNWARRKVAQRCIYGVDLNPLATELSKVSLWLRTLAAEQPLAFLDHHLKTGNSLLGSNVEDIEALKRNDGSSSNGPNSTLIDFGLTFEGTMENLMAIHSDLLAIENQELDDVKEMEKKYGEFESNTLRQRLQAIVDVYTAEEFSMEVPSGAYEWMAESLKKDGDWDDIESEPWYSEAQRIAEEKLFFNWRLEYPDIFYDQDGEVKDNPGFDVVLGNPPYINAIELNEITTVEKELWKKRFDSAKNAYDIYILFLEKSLELSRKDGLVGLIVPNKHLSAPYAEAYREYIIENHQLCKICDVSQLGVFEDPSVYPVIPFFRSHAEFHSIDKIEIEKPDSRLSISTFPRPSDTCLPSRLTEIGNNLWGPLLLDLEEQNVFWDVVQGTIPLKSEGTVQASSTASEAEEFTIALSEECPSDTRKRFVKTGGIDPFQSYWSTEEVRHQGEYYSRPVLDINNEIITDLRKEQYDSEKLIFAKVASILEAFIDTDAEYASVDTNFFYDSKLDIRYYGSILNSKAVLFLYTGMFGALRMRGGDFQFQAPQLKQIPIPSITPNADGIDRQELKNSIIDTYESYLNGETEIQVPDNDAVAHDVLAELADSITDLKVRRNSINLSLLDYLGIPSSGIPDSIIGETIVELRMPVSGVADTPLSRTTEDFTGLRIEGVSFDSEGNGLVMSVDISYKPDEEDSRETDRYGRLVEDEFETYEAMLFTGLSDSEEALLMNFLPEAVGRAGGFAGFRKSASKTITPIERLEEITLPDIDAVSDGLQEYTEVKQKAASLDNRIYKTDEYINKIVYDLYGLSDQNIRIIEATISQE